MTAEVSGAEGEGGKEARGFHGDREKQRGDSIPAVRLTQWFFGWLAACVLRRVSSVALAGDGLMRGG